MSSGPTLTGETCVKALKKKYVTLELSDKDWCTFKHYYRTCRVDSVINGKDLCLFCKYRKPLDIPKMIPERRD